MPPATRPRCRPARLVLIVPSRAEVDAAMPALRYARAVLDQLQLSTFEPLVGQRFVLRRDIGDATVDLVLAEATALAHGEGRPRTPFSLVFRGPAEPVMPQRIYRVDHEELGALELFLVPIGRDAESVRYEAIFT